MLPPLPTLPPDLSSPETSFSELMSGEKPSVDISEATRPVRHTAESTDDFMLPSPSQVCVILIIDYMHMALFGVRDGFFSAKVSESSPSLKAEGWIRTQVLRKPISHDKQCYVRFLARLSTSNMQQNKTCLCECKYVHNSCHVM